jgi:TonB-dependent SusC/RagA subfamily outer membrane receptor
MRDYLLPFLILLIFAFPVSIRAQRRTRIRGIITDENGSPLPGANIFIPALNLGAASDNNGKYDFFTPADESNGQSVKLTVSYVGYKSQTVLIKLNGENIEQDFSLEEDVFKSQEVVVTGLASKTSKSRAEVSVSRVNAAALTKTSSFQSMSQLVEGQISGVQVTSPSGNPGAGYRFYVRGGGGLNGDEQPVIYIDGIRVNNDEYQGLVMNGFGAQEISVLATLAPENIANIQVLKGPAAAAMYGTSGSNGVVLITTKSGINALSSFHKFSVNYKYVYGINTQSNKYSTGNYLSANSANAVFRDGPIRQNTLNISGGSNLLRYYGSFDDRYEQGIVANDDFNRKSFRINLASYSIQNFNIGVSAEYDFMDVTRPPQGLTSYGFLYNVLYYPDAYQEIDSASIYQLKDSNHIESITGGVQINYTPIDKLVFHFNGGIDNSNIREDLTYPHNIPEADFPGGIRSIYNTENKQFSYEFNGRYSYKILKGINVTSIFGAQLYERINNNSFFAAANFATPLITGIGAGSFVFAYDENFLNAREAGIFTEHDLSYLDQYFLTLGLREDYASTIGQEAPSIFYPKMSFALRLDKYKWFPSNVLSLFKVRAAYGENGQLPDPLASSPLLWNGTQSGYGVGATIYSIGNASIKPERIKEFETGFEAEFLKNYSFEFTYYGQNATNSIVYIQEPPSTGLTDSKVPFNIGAMKNWGIETLIQANLIRSKEFGLDLRLIWNYQRNEVTSLGGAQPIFDPTFNINVIKVGFPKHEFYAQEVLGARFNADGTYNTVNATASNVDLGNPIPNTTGSFSLDFKFLRNFNLYALAAWALNRKMLNLTKLRAVSAGNVPEYNILNAELDLTSDHPEITRLTPGTSQYVEAANRFAKMDPGYYSNYIEDAGYFRLKELSLSYSFRDILSKTVYNYIKDITVGISILNVWTLTNYTGSDVEINTLGSRSLTRGVDFFSLEHPRVYNFWVRVAI